MHKYRLYQNIRKWERNLHGQLCSTITSIIQHFIFPVPTYTFTLWSLSWPGSSDGFRRNICPFSLLDEVCSMTLEPGKTHPLKLVGLIYFQYYSSTKELFDVAKVYPWDNNSLEGLAIDPLLHEEWKKLANFSGAT